MSSARSPLPGNHDGVIIPHHPAVSHPLCKHNFPGHCVHSHCPGQDDQGQSEFTAHMDLTDVHRLQRSKSWIHDALSKIIHTSSTQSCKVKTLRSTEKYLSPLVGMDNNDYTTCRLFGEITMFLGYGKMCISLMCPSGGE